jgi:hypothetical protein
MPNIDLSILNQRQTPAFFASSLATRPAFGFAGRIFIDSDVPSTGLYRDTGTAWVQIADPGAGSTGTLQQVTTNGNTTTLGITVEGITVGRGAAGNIDNTAFGNLALSSNTTGGHNVAIGYNTLKVNTSGLDNTAVGYTSMLKTTIGGVNTAIGAHSLEENLSGSNNVAIGWSNLIVSNGSNNTSIGSTTGGDLTTGQNNTFIGFQTGRGITTGSYNTILGGPLTLPATLSNNIVLADGQSNVRLFSDANGLIAINQAIGSTPGGQVDIHTDQTYGLIINGLTTNNAYIALSNNNVGKWRLGNVYNANANDFGIYDLVANIQPVTIKNTTGQVLIGTSTVGSGKLVVASSTGDNGIQIVGASAPSLRIDNAVSGPTKRAGLGISTATNNFIQGSADRDFCIFNGSTTPSPILFGIYGTTNVLEAARISAVRNFLIGTTTDTANAGVLQVSNGITFPATQVAVSNANTLDDYEEGQFTPVVEGGTTPGTATYSAVNGRYTKTGNIVNFRIDLIWTGHTGTGQITITGLPFATAQQYMSLGIVRFDQAITALNYIGGHYIFNSTIYIEQMPVGGGAPSGIPITANGDFRISGFYIA